MLVTLIGILLVVLIALAVVLSAPIVEAVAQPLGLGSAAVTVWNIAKWPIMAVIVALLIAMLYYATPNVRLRGFKWVTVGAGVALLVWAIASALFAFYVANFGSYNKTYGALAGVVVFLVWFWITNLALLIGIELDAERERTVELKAGVLRADEEIQLDARDQPKRKQTTGRSTAAAREVVRCRRRTVTRGRRLPADAPTRGSATVVSPHTVGQRRTR